MNSVTLGTGAGITAIWKGQVRFVGWAVILVERRVLRLFHSSVHREAL